MKPKNDINRLIKKLNLKASAELDRRVHNDISKAMTEPEPVVAGPTIWRFIMKGGAMRLAVAAAVIVAFGFGFFIGQQSKKSQPTPSLAAVTVHPTAAKTEDSFWRQKVAAAMQPRPYIRTRFNKAGILDTYEQYLKEKYND
jgi:hypothetical protein